MRRVVVDRRRVVEDAAAIDGCTDRQQQPAALCLGQSVAVLAANHYAACQTHRRG
jgi:hypothetical protein